MSRHPMDDGFEHHVWASIQLIDVCIGRSSGQLNADVPGTYGSILDTLRHLVGSDSWYLFCMTQQATPRIDEDHMDLSELRAAMASDGVAWSTLLAQAPDPDAVISIRREDGSETRAAMGIRLAQVLHHGTDHRSQICTALTTLGIEPPFIDVWDFGQLNGRVVDVPTPTEV